MESTDIETPKSSFCLLWPVVTKVSQGRMKQIIVRYLHLNHDCPVHLTLGLYISNGKEQIGNKDEDQSLAEYVCA